jgi:hypothetical protein
MGLLMYQFFGYPEVVYTAVKVYSFITSLYILVAGLKVHEITLDVHCYFQVIHSVVYFEQVRFIWSVNYTTMLLCN